MPVREAKVDNSGVDGRKVHLGLELSKLGSQPHGFSKIGMETSYFTDLKKKKVPDAQ